MTDKIEFEGLVAESGCTADELRTIFESNPVLYATAKILQTNEKYGIEVKMNEGKTYRDGFWD